MVWDLLECFLEFAEVLNDFLEVLVGVYVEAIPDVAEHYDPSEFRVAKQGQVVESCPSQCVDIPIDKFLLVQLFEGE